MDKMETLWTVMILIICGHRFWFVGALPRFTSWPNSKNPIYKKVGETAEFQWEFFRDGATFSFGTLRKVDPAVTIAQLRPGTGTSPGSVIGAGYSGRSSLIATDRSNNYFTITFELKQLIRTDDGDYEFDVHTTVNSVKGPATLVVVVPPTITYRNPTGDEITITEGQVQTLECAADGNPKPRVEWLRDDIVVETNKNVTLNPITRQHNGSYRCEATVVADKPYKMSFTIEVNVRYKPYITTGLNNRTVSESNSVLFECEANGNPDTITYAWYKNNVNLLSSGNYEISNGDKRLRIKSAGKGDIGQYKCTGTNLIGTGEGSVGYLTVKYKPTLVAVAPYPDVTREELESVTLTCQADGEPPPSYKWEFNGDVITGQTGKSLVLNSLRKSNIGNYSCVATNEIGVTKNYTMVFVRYKPTTVNLTTGTADNSVVQGTTASLVCISDGYPEPTYTFKKGSKDEVVDSVSRTYTIKGQIALSHEGEYSCIPKNIKGDGPTATMRLTVLVKPVLTNNIQPATRKENQNFTYTCTVTGKPAPSIRWYKDGKEISKSSIYNIVETVRSSTTPKVLETQGDLIMTGLTWRQDGNYVCLASNSAGNDSNEAQLTIQHRPVVKTAADHPKNQTIREGDDVTFSCRMIGNPKLDGYFWQVNGKNVSNFNIKPDDSSTLTVTNAKASNVGTYSCLGYNSLGTGPPANAYLLIKIKPVIIEWPEEKLIVNESSSAQMICKANGVPEPTYSWTKDDSQSIYSKGALLFIANASYSDTGKYKCTAKNEMGTATKERQLVIQVKPDILTTSPLETNIARNPTKNTATLRCRALTVPHAQMEWRKGGKKIESGKKYEISTTQEPRDKSSIAVTVTEIANTVAEKYTCFAKNLLGADEQIFVIREKGIIPDKPIELDAMGEPAENAGNVQLNLTWTPGYGGGLEQTFIVSYWKKGNQESIINTPDVECNLYRLCALTIEKLEPETTYEFQVQAKNKVGFGEKSQTLTYKTPASKQRGTVIPRRIGNGEEVVLSWTFTDKKVNRVKIYYREKDSGTWILWKENVQKMNDTITELSPNKAYQFRVEMLYPDEVTGMGVIVEVPAYPGTGRREGSILSATHIIAIAAACAGFVFIALVVLALCLCKKRKKPYGRDDRVEMSQTRTPPFTSYAAGGPDIMTADQRNRQSYGLDTLEDDPFVEAHRDAMKKKKPDPSVNYGYASQGIRYTEVPQSEDSFQQREVLLEPGSRLPRNERMTRSMDDLDPGHDYSARGPQRDFSTLPPYHEPPSFEEAMRQSGKKAKHRVRSTGDILDEGRPRQSARRSRHTPRSPDDQTDSSESEARYQRRPPPGRKLRSLDSDEDPGYASVDPALAVPRHPTAAPPRDALDRRRNGPPDPEVPYAIPQKRNKNRKPPQSDSTEPLMGPPPQYTPEDRMSMPGLDGYPRNTAPFSQPPRSRPQPIAANNLDLDDQEQPDPDLPPAMPMFPATRSYPSLHDPDDGLPDPPAFLRDSVDGEIGLRSSRGRDSGFATEPRQPGRKPYVNVHGQLVRPGSPAASTRSSRSDGLDRLDPMRSSSHALLPEPEVPHAQRHQPPPENDDQQTEMNYVSYLV